MADLNLRAGTNITLEQDDNDLVISSEVDLSNYYTKSEADTLLSEKYVKPNTGIPKTDLSTEVQRSLNNADDAATTSDLNNEISNRQIADNNLQSQIDAIAAGTDVVDVVGTYSDLEDYDTSSLTNNDVIKVLSDSTHNDASTYYRWVINQGVGNWSYVGSEGAFYTKSETNTLLADKVGFTDYATGSKGGVFKISTNYGLYVTNTGFLQTEVKNYSTYQSASNYMFIGKGTLENVITGKGIVDSTKIKTTENTTAGNVYDVTYINSLIGDIDSVLDAINGEVIS